MDHGKLKSLLVLGHHGSKGFGKFLHVAMSRDEDMDRLRRILPKTRQQAQLMIFDYIHCFYNSRPRQGKRI